MTFARPRFARRSLGGAWLASLGGASLRSAGRPRFARRSEPRFARLEASENGTPSGEPSAGGLYLTDPCRTERCRTDPPLKFSGLLVWFHQKELITGFPRISLFIKLLDFRDFDLISGFPISGFWRYSCFLMHL